MLWRKHQPGLLRWLRSVERQAAEDLASDAWIDTLRKCKTFVGDEAGFRSLLFTVARRRLIDYRRRLGRRPDSVREWPPEMMWHRDIGEDVADADAAERSIALVIGTLSPDQAEVVLLRVVGGLDVAQVAEVVGKSHEAVRVLQHRGVRKLAGALSATGAKAKQEV